MADVLKQAETFQTIHTENELRNFVSLLPVWKRAVNPEYQQAYDIVREVRIEKPLGAQINTGINLIDTHNGWGKLSSYVIAPLSAIMAYATVKQSLTPLALAGPLLVESLLLRHMNSLHSQSLRLHYMPEATALVQAGYHPIMTDSQAITFSRKP